MKELIEKIKTLICDNETSIENLYDERSDSYKARNHDIDIELECEKSHLESLNNLLKEMEKEESKPFTPEELGFKRSKRKIDIGVQEVYVYYKKRKKVKFEIYKIKGNLWNIEIIDLISCINFDVKIPSHRFGQELLKNLGVI